MKNNTIQVETHWAAKAEIDRFGCLKTNWFFLNEGRPLILLDFENLTFGFLIHQTSRGRVVVFGKNSRIYLDYAGYLNYDLIKSPRKRS